VPTFLNFSWASIMNVYPDAPIANPKIIRAGNEKNGKSMGKINAKTLPTTKQEKKTTGGIRLTLGESSFTVLFVAISLMGPSFYR
jgi:hypothetical protein